MTGGARPAALSTVAPGGCVGGAQANTWFFNERTPWRFAYAHEGTLQALAASGIVTAPITLGKLVRKREGFAGN
ncbi:hypothetical protein [Candidatus Methylacidithermus pantelleriae]|uniref:Uncharacterized protein n=1 Tax=Candidatus Methylacidithermus pantelleriae TaxID=2744239 RepID=A0A8J2FPG7_9BACT|nr:hypothetical protein [Candidatus Methylacidithermus pantelleriae]CAF0702550.1 hypothetical protein MPNT_50112 [Candidatus Methylacidithermus pantelleriae]